MHAASTSKTQFNLVDEIFVSTAITIVSPVVVKLTRDFQSVVLCYILCEVNRYRTYTIYLPQY